MPGFEVWNITQLSWKAPFMKRFQLNNQSAGSYSMCYVGRKLARRCWSMSNVTQLEASSCCYLTELASDWSTLNFNDRRFIQSSFFFSEFGLPFPNIFCGLFNCWIREIVPRYWGNDPFGRSGYSVLISTVIYSYSIWSLCMKAAEQRVIRVRGVRGVEH